MVRENSPAITIEIQQNEILILLKEISDVSH